ncbi:MAG TPA: DUF2232 domain-containing protein [Gemmatimonadaceae bacterium]|jgi:hypothetical protein|nr:DUF2232 domain-containing protein [Gemmatimonadaceae bacterium]
MADAATTETKSRSWRPLFWGLAAFLILPYLPPLDALIPVQQTLLVLIAIIASCAIIDWKLGGRLAMVLIWVALAAWMLLHPAGQPGTQYDQMARGWVVLLAASFGLVSLWNTSAPFLSRALFAIGLAVAVGFSLALSSPSGIARFQHAAGEEFTRRVNTTIQKIEEGRSEPAWKEITDKAPWFDALNDESESMMRDMPSQSAALLPALLALESLAALGLGWAVYQRFAPERLGPQLGRLMDFRFNDQLVWGLAVGATLSLLPAFGEARNAGYNLLLFFGALYLIRGTGVLVWLSRGRYVYLVILGFIPWLLVGVTVMLGLGDTWLDLRRRSKSA